MEKLAQAAVSRVEYLLFFSVALYLLRKYLSRNLESSILASNLTPTLSARVVDTRCQGQLLRTLQLGRHWSSKLRSSHLHIKHFIY